MTHCGHKPNRNPAMQPPRGRTVVCYRALETQGEAPTAPSAPIQNKSGLPQGLAGHPTPRHPVLKQTALLLPWSRAHARASSSHGGFPSRRRPPWLHGLLSEHKPFALRFRLRLRFPLSLPCHNSLLWLIDRATSPSTLRTTCDRRRSIARWTSRCWR